MAVEGGLLVNDFHVVLGTSEGQALNHVLEASVGIGVRDCVWPYSMTHKVVQQPNLISGLDVVLEYKVFLMLIIDV